MATVMESVEPELTRMVAPLEAMLIGWLQPTAPEMARVALEISIEDSRLPRGPHSLPKL